MRKLIVLLVLLLVACNPKVSQQSVISEGSCQAPCRLVVEADDSVLAWQVEVDDTETPEPTPTATETASPTPTLEPTPTAPPQPTDTPEPTPTILPSPTTPPVIIGEHFVAPDGTAAGDGSISAPWDLQTALNHPAGINPGDTIWLRGGKYGSGGNTLFVSRLNGSADGQITLRPYSGEHAVIDGGISVEGSYSTWRDLEVMNSNTKRTSTTIGSHPEDIYRPDGFNVLDGPENHFINNVLHDVSGGIGFWEECSDCSAYGNIMFNNGWFGPDRGHGNGMYIQNNIGTKLIEDNLVGRNFSNTAIQAYSKAGQVDNITFIGNLTINHAVFLIGAYYPMNNINVIDNFTYQSKLRLYYESLDNESIVVSGNYLYSLEQAMDLRYWQNATVISNTIIAKDWQTVNYSAHAQQGEMLWDYNDYYVPAARQVGLYVDMVAKTFDQWKELTGFDAHSTHTLGNPKGLEVFVRPNRYERGRGNILIYNWDNLSEVNIDIETLGLDIGETYELHNIQDYYGRVISGVYDGNPIIIPMTDWIVAKPIGYDRALTSPTTPQFGAFVLIGQK